MAGVSRSPVLDGLHDGLRRHMPTGAYRALTLTPGQLGDAAELLGAARIQQLTHAYR